MPRTLQLPPAVRAWLVGRVERSWPDPPKAIAHIPAELPEGEVRALVGGGPFGHYFAGRLDEVDGQIALEVLENDRMSGESYYRVWEDGTIEWLVPAPLLAWSHGPDDTPEQIEAAQAAYFAHNREAYALLERRGFM
jgi:hypothetical protein